MFLSSKIGITSPEPNTVRDNHEADDKNHPSRRLKKFKVAPTKTWCLEQNMLSRIFRFIFRINSNPISGSIDQEIREIKQEISKLRKVANSLERSYHSLKWPYSNQAYGEQIETERMISHMENMIEKLKLTKEQALYLEADDTQSAAEKKIKEALLLTSAVQDAYDEVKEHEKELIEQV